MIYTVTLNPSLDYIVRMDKLTPGEINRADYEQIKAGGKGINVSIVLHNLGHDSVALGFVAGFTGDEIRREMHSRNIYTDFVHLAHGFSRINVKTRAGEETEINGRGPVIDQTAQEDLMRRLSLVDAADTLVLAGSIPKSLPNDIYARICSHVPEGTRVVVDAEKDLLVDMLRFHPFLVKPNQKELGDIFGVSITNDADTETYARKLQEKGARNVIISMAASGAMMVTEDGRMLRVKAPSGELVNSVGAGDSMLAGFLASLQETGDLERAFYAGVATGSASVYSDELATRENAEALLRKMLER